MPESPRRPTEATVCREHGRCFIDEDGNHLHLHMQYVRIQEGVKYTPSEWLVIRPNDLSSK